jgi:hypothetical protein
VYLAYFSTFLTLAVEELFRAQPEITNKRKRTIDDEGNREDLFSREYDENIEDYLVSAENGFLTLAGPNSHLQWQR